MTDLLETFLFPMLNDSDDSGNSLARGSIARFLKDSLQETVFNGCHYSNGSVLDMKYFCCWISPEDSCIWYGDEVDVSKISNNFKASVWVSDVISVMRAKDV